MHNDINIQAIVPSTNQWVGGICLTNLAGIYSYHIGNWWKTRQMVNLIVWAGFHLSAGSDLMFIQESHV